MIHSVFFMFAYNSWLTILCIHFVSHTIDDKKSQKYYWRNQFSLICFKSFFISGTSGNKKRKKLNCLRSISWIFYLACLTYALLKIPKKVFQLTFQPHRFLLNQISPVLNMTLVSLTISFKESIKSFEILMRSLFFVLL